MERSTKASENMATLQHSAMQQWIDIDGWKTMPVRGQGITDILIRFEIRNPTGFPITIRDSVITFGIFDERIKYLIGKDFRLSPKIPKEIVITMWLKDEELNRFRPISESESLSTWIYSYGYGA